MKCGRWRVLKKKVFGEKDAKRGLVEGKEEEGEKGYEGVESWGRGDIKEGKGFKRC